MQASETSDAVVGRQIADSLFYRKLTDQQQI